MDYVQVAENEEKDEIELPTEEDGTLLLSTLQAQFSGASGLKYRNIDTNAMRGVRCNEGRLYPPCSENGWGDDIYLCVFPSENKRKNNDNLNTSAKKTKRVKTPTECTDLIVLDLPWKSTEDDLREYFETFGTVVMAQVKKDTKTGQSKGFGFVKFESYEVQMRVLSSKHRIDGRWCEVKIPNSKGVMQRALNNRIFVGRCTEDISTEDLREYFSKFGEVTDVYIPKPFRKYGFVTFLFPHIAQSVCDEEHEINGVSVHVSSAAPKTENRGSGRDRNNYKQANNNGNGFNNRNNSNNSTYNRGSKSNYAGNSVWDNQSNGNTGNNSVWDTKPFNTQGSNQSNQGQNQSGGGVNLNSLGMNPAVVAAALNLLGNQLRNMS